MLSLHSSKNLIIVFLHIVFVNTTFSNDITWQQVGSPQGLRVEQFSYNSKEDIFICTWWHPADLIDNGAIHRIERSTDNGNSWLSVLQTGWEPICATIDSADNIFAGTLGKIYRSFNNGNSWEIFMQNDSISFIHTIAMSPENHIYIGSNGGNYCSKDNGNHWETLALEYQAKAFLFLKNGDILAGVTSGYFPDPPQYIYRSTDNGNSWLQVLTAKKTFGWSMATNQDGTVFAATEEYDSTAGGVYRSTNNGSSWTRVNNGLPSRNINSLVINSLDYIFVGIWGQGVYRSIDDGKTWNNVSKGLTDLRIKSLGMNINNILFVGTGTNELPTSDTEEASIFRGMTITSVQQIDRNIQKKFEISENYPNPFNPITTIQFDLPQLSDVRLEVVNLLGQRISTLMDRKLSAGNHSVVWNGKNEKGQEMASGLYLMKLTAGNRTVTRKMFLIR